MQYLSMTIGVAAALVLAYWIYRRQKWLVYIWAYVITVLLYVIFAAISVNMFWIMTEVLAAGFFLVFAWLSLKHSYWFLAFGWAVHTIWDNVIYDKLSAPYVPSWYPGFCLGFDLIMAVAVVVHCVRVEAKGG